MMSILSFDLERYQHSFKRADYKDIKTPLTNGYIFIAMLILNAITLNVIPDKVMVSEETQNLIEHLKFLMPDTEIIRLYANDYRKSIFAFTWLYYTWGIFYLLDIFVFIAEKETMVHNIISVIKGNKIPSQRKRIIITRVVILLFAVFSNIYLNGLMASSKIIGAYTEVIHMSIVVNFLLASFMMYMLHIPIILIIQGVFHFILRRRILV